MEGSERGFEVVVLTFWVPFIVGGTPSPKSFDLCLWFEGTSCPAEPGRPPAQPVGDKAYEAIVSWFVTETLELLYDIDLLSVIVSRFEIVACRTFGEI